MDTTRKTQPSGAVGTRLPHAMSQRLQHLTARLIQNGRQGLEIGQTLVYWTLKQLSQNKFFVLIIPSTRLSLFIV